MYRFTFFVASIIASMQWCMAEQLSVQLIDRSTKLPLQGGVVFVSPIDNTNAEEIGRVRSHESVHYNIVQKDDQFIPKTLVIPVGAQVTFPNQDSYKHHVYSFSPTKPFELKLYSGLPHTPVTFDKPGVATLGCNIHDKMSAHVLVTDEPHHAMSDEQGWATVDGLKPGRYTWRVWHPQLKKSARTKKVTVKRYKSTTRTVKLNLRSLAIDEDTENALVKRLRGYDTDDSNY